MFSEAPELYDQIYGAFKDYSGEARQVAALLARKAPNARSLLDVGCGTGEHARLLQDEHGYRVDGLDIEEGFIELARKKVPSSRFWCDDMADFSIQSEYDAIVCLFSSIGYVGSVERLASTFRSFRSHLRPGGVVVVEPWFEPEDWFPGRVYVHTSEADGLHVVRMSHSGQRDQTSLLDFHYLIGRPEGIEHRVEHHELVCFTQAQMRGAFETAGFAEVEYDAEGLIGRGMYVARVDAVGASPGR